MPLPGSLTLPGATTYPGSPETLTFNPPYVERAQHELGLRFKLRYGISVYRVAGVWGQSEAPDYTTIVAVADRFYAGGHVHVISNVLAGELIVAGYAAYIT